MSLPKEPRQLMINLMYLVLTALLAMNVSSEILNAFKIIGKSINTSNKATSDRNKAVTEGFDKYISDPKTNAEKKKKVSEALLLANEVNSKTDAIVAEIQKYKQLIIDKSGGIDPATGEIAQIENLDASSFIMIKQGNGSKLLNTLKQFKDDIAGLVPIDETRMVAPGNGNNPAIYNILPLNFDVEKSDNNPNGDWSHANFHMTPTIAGVTLLDKYISDVRASQSAALDNIWSLATGEKVDKVHTQPRPFNDYAIIVSADNNFVLPGEKYHARVMMGTYNKKMNNLSFTVNGRTITPVEGVADYSEIANAVGQRNISVTASFNDTIPGTKTVQRRTITLPKPATYYVGEAQASISLDKMNVMYVGLENPITVAASGVPANAISLSTENCTLNKTDGIGKYTSTVTKPGSKAKITLSGKLADGTTKTFGTYEYRVKIVPSPYPMIAQKRGGTIAANALKAQEVVFAKLEDFVYDLDFPVVSFSVAYQAKNGTYDEAVSNSRYLSGPQANAQVKDILAKLRPGDRIYFENIRAKAPDGIRNIGTVSFLINN
ncbi:MAG: GldM family protein [Chitinophagaceae bacterium]